MKYAATLIICLLIQSTLIAQNYGDLHYFESFDDNSAGWYTGSKDDIDAEIKDGHYILNHKDGESSNYYQLKTKDIDFKTQNFTIEAKIKQSGGDEGQGMGLRFCIYSDWSNYRDFLISSSGYHKLNHYYSKKSHLIKDWTLEKDKVKPKGEYNIFRVERRAQTIWFYLNDVMIGYSTDNLYYTSRIGFFVSGVNEISVDYLKVWTSPFVINYVDDPLEDVELENLGSNVNTIHMEKAPVPAPDGSHLYYNRTETVAEDEEEDAEIYCTILQADGSWGLGEKVGKPLNNVGNNSVIAVLPDGNTMLIMNTYNADGTSNGGGISIARRNAGGWEVPKDVIVDDYHNRNDYAGYNISPSGNVLISAVERDETVGGRDLYVSFKQAGDTWSKPIGINSLNTVGNEDMPFIAADNKTMYFSSNGHPGLGGSDVFVTRRLDDTWTNWSEPENLGSAINSSNDEFGFKLSAKGDYAFLYKFGDEDEGGFGSGDLFRVKLSESAKPEAVVFVHGHVFDSETMEPISADITYEDLTTHTEIGVAFSEPDHGKYKIALPYGSHFGYLAHKEGYYSISQNIDLTTEDILHKSVIKDLYLTPIKKGVGIRLHNIFFEADKSDLKKSSHTELNRLVKLLNDNPELKIEIGGHTDITGDFAYNERLSMARATAVMNYLIDGGINGDRLTAMGYGEKNPVKTNDTDEGKAMNRRVEFKIL